MGLRSLHDQILERLEADLVSCRNPEVDGVEDANARTLDRRDVPSFLGHDREVAPDHVQVEPRNEIVCE